MVSRAEKESHDSFCGFGDLKKKTGQQKFSADTNGSRCNEVRTLSR